MADPTHEMSSAAAYARLLSLASHELRTPASVVGGYLQMLAKDPAPALGERQRKMIAEAQNGCVRIIELVGQLSEVAALDSGRAAVNKQTFDLFSMLATVAAGIRPAEEPAVSLQIRGNAESAPLTGDFTRLKTGFEAIFRAVLREQATACTVVVDRRRSSAGDQRSAVIVVAREQDLEQVRESDRTAFDDMRGGLGLALPIARRVIESHGGQIWAAATGRAVVVRLPIAGADG